ncbi:hypothetical protein OHB24_16340 [Kribbella sp. NBC_00482]|uniref:hypothetical protein n=1 Tax=Kribbella sp. NBC_00482 TaxID=2975968 RepID=UPI002E16F498
MAEELEAEDLLRILVREFRRLKSMGQNLWNRLSSQQRRRAGIERGILQDRWGPDRNPDVDVRDRTAQLEREAARAENQVRDLEGQNENLRGDVDRLREQNQDRDLNNDRDRDGIDDRVENRTDLDRDHRDDATERRDDIDQQNDNANDRDGDGVDDAVERREADRAREDDEKRKRDEQNSQQNREDGIDPATAGTAAGAALAADEIADEQNADDRQDVEADNESDVDADSTVDDPSAEADNVRETEPAAEQEDVNPYVAEEGALDPNDRLNENDGQQTDPTLDADGEPKVDADNAVGDPSAEADNALEDSSVDADSAVDDPSAEADNVRDTEPAAEQEGVNPYVAEEGALDNDDRLQQTDLAQEGQDSALDGDELDGSELDESGLDANDGQHTDVSAEQDGVNPYVAEETGVDNDLQNDGTELGQDGQEADPQQVDSPQVDAQQVDNPQVDAQQVGDPQVDTQAVNGQQVEAPQADTQQVDAQQVQASGQGAEAGQDGAQPPQPKGPDTQQIANASQNAVDETAGLGQEDGQSPGSQTEGPSTSQAQGSQWRPPEQAAEDPAIADAKAQGNKQRSGPAQALPPDEQAQFDNTRGDQEPLSKVKVDSAGVATNDRPGTPAAQRGQDRNRGQGNDGRGNDGGRER